MASRWLVAAVVAGMVSGGRAVPQQLMYPFGPEQGDKSLPPADDASSDEIALSVPIVFTDTAYNALYVSSILQPSWQCISIPAGTSIKTT